MAWAKNLGKIKGEDGDVYLPDISIVDGKLHFGWERKTAEEAELILTHGKDLTMPVYVPNIETNENNEPTGWINFSLSQTVRDASNTVLPDVRFYAKGATGEPGSVAFDIQHFIENTVYNITNPQPNTIYVKDKQAWFYDPSEEDFFMIEGLDLSQYYKKTETYSKNEIDNMFNEVTSQMELAYRLLEIEETMLSNAELGE